MKKILVFLLLNLCLIYIYPQNNTAFVSGNVVDETDKHPVAQATIQLLSSTDKKLINGIISDAKGSYKIVFKNSGNYLLRISFVGYTTKNIPLKLVAGSNHNIGQTTLNYDAVMLGEAIVTAQAPPVRSVEDTLIFNASSFKVTDGAVLEELVERLPGIEIEEDNKVKLNGQNIKKINVNGKEFFGGDIETALKNLPVDLIEEIKSYDKKSDMEQMTGIDDGNDELVLDIKIKKKKNNGFFGNADLAIGNYDRYQTKVMANKFKDKTQFSVIASANNVNSNGFRGGAKSKWQTNKGLTAAKSAGTNLSFETSKLEFDGSVDYRSTDQDIYGENSTQRFLTYSNSFSNSNSFTLSSMQSIRGSFRMLWKINPKTTLLFRPNFNLTSSDESQRSMRSLFNDDPLKWVSNPNQYLDPNDYPLNEEGSSDNLIDSLEASRVNYSKTGDFSNVDKSNASGLLLLNRRLSESGRNIGVQIGFGYNDNSSDRLNNLNTTYCLITDQEGSDSTYMKNYFIPVATNSWNYSARLNYSEPIAKSTFLQVSYQFLYKNNTTDRRTYNLLGYPDWMLNDPYPENMEENQITSFGKNANYDYYNHNISTTFRMIRPKFNLSIGVSLQPQHTVLTYNRGETHIETSRNVFNYSPQINIKYKFSKLTMLKFQYHGRSSQPAMEQLLPITDDTNPLNIKVGNPDLLPSFSHDVGFNFNSYHSETQSSVVVNANFSAIQNSFSNNIEYNEQTGGQTVTPENINGDWNGNFTFAYNTALKNQKFHVNTSSTLSYNNNVGYLYDKTQKQNFRNRVTNLHLIERLGAVYRNDWIEFGVNGSINYSFEKNKVRPLNNQEPYLYSYGASLALTMSWNMSINTNIVSQQRCGYSDKNLNRNEIIWNAQISQSLFKSSTILSFEIFDILHQKSNIARSLTASTRSITIYNSINSYAMVHLIYRLNIMGGRKMNVYNKNRKKNSNIRRGSKR